MELSTRIISALNLSNLFGDPFSVFEEPLRYELFSPERLEQETKRLVVRQQILVDSGKALNMAPRLAENIQVITQAYRTLRQLHKRQYPLSPPAEIFLRHFNSIRLQLDFANYQLDMADYRSLPRLASGPFKGYTRIYEMVGYLVAHSDSRPSLDALIRFIGAYQRIEPLAAEEISALPTTLRMVLIENLRRIVVGVIAAHHARVAAEKLAEELVGEHSRQSALQRLAALPASPPHTAFLAQLSRCLQLPDNTSDEAIMLAQSLDVLGTTPDQVIAMEKGADAISALTMNNIVFSLGDSLVQKQWDELPGQLGVTQQISTLAKSEESGLAKCMPRFEDHFIDLQNLAHLAPASIGIIAFLMMILIPEVEIRPEIAKKLPYLFGLLLLISGSPRRTVRGAVGVMRRNIRNHFLFHGDHAGHH